jgi:hypothetical protein
MVFWINIIITILSTIILSNQVGAETNQETTTVSIEILNSNLDTMDENNPKCIVKAKITVHHQGHFFEGLKTFRTSIYTDKGKFKGDISVEDKKRKDEFKERAKDPSYGYEKQKIYHRKVKEISEKREKSFLPKNISEKKAEIDVTIIYLAPRADHNPKGIDDTLKVELYKYYDFKIVDDTNKGSTQANFCHPAYAILIQGKASDAEGMEAHNKTLNFVYRTLQKRGFIKDYIRYFNYDKEQDLDNNGKNDDIVGYPTTGKIGETIEQWLAGNIIKLPAPAYIIMVDHGNPNGEFYLDGDNITANALKGWLGNLENTLDNEKPTALAQSRFVIAGMCYSGKLIPELSQENRIIITSSKANEQSFKGEVEEDDIRIGEAFIHELFTYLGDDKSFMRAFEKARDRIIKDYDSQQNPLLDDDGDDEGHGMMSANLDGKFVEHLYLGIREKPIHFGPKSSIVNFTKKSVELGIYNFYTRSPILNATIVADAVVDGVTVVDNIEVRGTNTLPYILSLDEGHYEIGINAPDYYTVSIGRDIRSDDEFNVILVPKQIGMSLYQNGMLEVPSVYVPNSGIYSAQLRLIESINGESWKFELASANPPQENFAVDNMANFSEGKVLLPIVNIDGGYYQIEMKLINDNPLQFEWTSKEVIKY